MGDMFLCQSMMLSDNSEPEYDAVALKHTHSGYWITCPKQKMWWPHQYIHRLWTDTGIVRLWTLAMPCLWSCYLHGTLCWDMPFYSQNNDRSNMHPTFRIKGKDVRVPAMKV